MYFLSFDTRNYTAPGYCIMEHVDLKRCGRRGSDVLHSEQTHYDVVMMHGSVEYCVRSACCRSCVRACIYYTHALTWTL